MEKELKITIVFDNVCGKGLMCGWGFSCWIEYLGTHFLFDFGPSPKSLSFNIKALSLPYEKLFATFLSHLHIDHTGGLLGLPRRDLLYDLYISDAIDKKSKDNLFRMNIRVLEVSSLKEIRDNVYLSGPLGTMNEQALFIKTKKGIVVITGCAHPGVVNIARVAKDLLSSKIYLILGGFHLIYTDRGKIEKIGDLLKELSVERIAPCHCSGDLAKKILKDKFSDSFLEVKAGDVIKI